MALVLSGSINISGSMTATTIVVSAPGAPGMVSSSNQLVELNTATGSIKGEIAGIEAYTASLKGAIEVSGQNVNVLGTITAQQFNVTYVSSSVMYQSGSNKFGNSSDDRHEFTGSLFTSGSVRLRLGTNENVNILTVGSGDTRISAINDAADTTVQLSIQASPLLFRGAGGVEAMRISTGGILEMRPITFSSVANNAVQTIIPSMGKGTWLVSVANDVDSSDGYSAMLWVRTNEIIEMQVFRADSMVFSYTNQDLKIQNTSGFAATLFVTAIRMAAS